jgi:hypothetical protein
VENDAAREDEENMNDDRSAGGRDSVAIGENDIRAPPVIW